MILQTDYTRRIWTGLTTDNWGEANLQEGDVIYLMDVSECYVGGEGQMYQLPDLGGGGAPSTWKVTINNGASFTVNAVGAYMDDLSGVGNRGLYANTSKTFDIPIWAGSSGGSYGYQLQLRYSNNKTTTIAAAPNNEFVVSDEFTQTTIRFRMIYIKEDNAIINIT